MTENKEHKKSPIKDPPVRMPGQSLRERIDCLIGEDAMPWAIGAVFAIIVAIYEWLAFFGHTPRLPRLFTVIAAVIILMAAVKIRRTIRNVKKLQLGQSGEETVGQFLEEKLRPAGYQVLHDIVNDKGNVDHVVIGPTGIYTIETKAHSKPQKGLCLVTYDGEIVKVNGVQPDRDPVVQALAEARWLRDLIEAGTGKKFKVQPVVLYPGWYIKASVKWPEVWVMNHISFTKSLVKHNAQISDEDINLITCQLKSYVIAREKQAKATKQVVFDSASRRGKPSGE